MGKYGDTAARALELLRSTNVTAEDAWRQAAEETFPDAPSARAKSCPRETFLGLCQDGRLRRVSADRCTPSGTGKNRHYASVAADLLARRPDLAAEGKAGLWRRVMENAGAEPNKRHNQQLDVVLALHEELEARC
jgi:hypothetical protein